MVNNYSFAEPKLDSSTGGPPWSHRTRPLSDIREITEPSLAENALRRPLQDASLGRNTSISRKVSVASTRRPSTDGRYHENRDPVKRQSEDTAVDSSENEAEAQRSHTPSPPTPVDNTYSSIYSIPRSNVPVRSSSRARTRSTSRSRQPPPIRPTQAPLPVSQRHAPAAVLALPPPPPSGLGNTIPRRGKSRSPLREVAARLDPVACDTYRHIPSRTFVREPLSADILEYPTHRHPRVAVGLELSAGIFVGGGSIEGTVQIHIDDVERIRHRRTLDIARISIDLLGLEEMTGTHRRSVFLNLANELIDLDNPPPYNMVETQEQISLDDPFWHLMPSFTSLPFIMSLPLDVGPPPFHSKIARIRYVLCVSLLIRDHGKQYIVRTSEDISVLSVYDPEKALVSLPSPLTASDEYIRPRDSTIESVKVTAGLHRQVWVSGTSIYVDVHIVNNSRKFIKKIELQLERDILCYKHAAAATMEKSASQARIFDMNERSVLSKKCIKQGTAGWNGVPAHSTHIRTCDLELPRGHGTVKCGKYFEVRYFLNVIVSSGHTKLVTVQLPIVLIHMNSLDVVPNSVAQVAAAISEKRTHHTFPRAHSPPRLSRRPSITPSVQGRAFAAPRMQSLDRLRSHAEDLHELGQMLDASPRRHGGGMLRRVNSNWDYHTPPSNRKGRVLESSDMAEIARRLRSVRSNDSLASKHTVPLNRGISIRSKQGAANGVGAGRKGAQSALGFREAEVKDDMELAGLAVGGEASFKERLEKSREKQFQFRKMRSVERWKGIQLPGGWKGLKGGGEKEKEGWI